MDPAREVSDAAVRLTWTVTEPDVVASVARTSRSRRWSAAAAMTAGLATVLGTAAATPGAGRVGGLWAAALITALIAHALWLRPRQIARWLVRNQPEAWPLEPQALEAGRAGVVHTVRGSSHTYPWPAIQRVVVERGHVFLHLSAVQVVTVPRRAFGPESAERQALANLRAWHRRAEVPALGAPELAGLDDFALRYVIRREDFVAFTQAIQRQQLRVRPWWVVSGGLLLVLLLLLGGPLAEGGVDPLTVGFASAFAFAVALLGVGPWWIPRLITPLAIRFALWRDPARLPGGDVDLRIGPAGGWSHSSRGLSRFGWRDVTDVLEAEGVVALMFGPLTGVIVPDRALGDERDAFVARCGAWMRGAPRGDPPPSPAARRPPGELPDPFAPPST